MNILTLDGGGSKGIYTLGILNELEKLLNKPLHDHFDIVYGTSTGSIIASMIGLGYTIESIIKKYYELIPKIMNKNSAASKSAELKLQLEEEFGEKKFMEFLTGVAIVSMNYEREKPFIFKRNVEQAYRLKATFSPGFGATIAQAIQASCAAYPIFEKVLVKTENQGDILAVDGGFIANNPTLFAITDAKVALKEASNNVAILSLGTGNFIEKSMGWKSSFFKSLQFVQLFEKMLKASSSTTEILIDLNFSEIPLVRINETFNQPEYGTNFVETDVEKLKLLQRLGRESFERNEDKIKTLFKI
ncbi:patatin-like phospholipase family protein [Sphingobacterium prati]|uniref:patatin-like phospholipase family protein n=1 Tax=Sphingobacterium prati TaxID=2737006 RepID=UPI0015523C9B|nr:patatin-like phospholipase family protein [Sphingobacterium prati]NPE46321.1 patatin-like phospholipase family protein [Sphingobacterium prati]